MERHCHIQLPFMCNCNNPTCPKQSSECPKHSQLSL